MANGRPITYTPTYRLEVTPFRRPRYRSMRRDIYDYVLKRGTTQIRFIVNKWGEEGRQAVIHMLRNGALRQPDGKERVS